MKIDEEMAPVLRAFHWKTKLGIFALLEELFKVLKRCIYPSRFGKDVVHETAVKLLQVRTDEKVICKMRDLEVGQRPICSCAGRCFQRQSRPQEGLGGPLETQSLRE